jgi:predicted alpha/beta-fold hydrolase
LESECDFWTCRERFHTKDGDFFDVDYKFVDDNSDLSVEKRTSDGMVIIIHGLESNSNSSLCTNMGNAFIEKNMDVACINFRGCSGQPNDTILQYHGGFTDDVLHFLNVWRERNKSKMPLYLSGFSLGSNVALKLLGDLSSDAVEKYNIRGAAVSGAPFDLEHHYRQLIDYDFHRIVYAGSVLKSMKKKVNYLVDRFYGGDPSLAPFDYNLCMNAKTIAEIEDGMIAPLYGFEDRFDYYRQSASLPVIDRIAVPTFVLNAADDPFFNTDKFPLEKDCEVGGVAPIKLVRTSEGGHIGHLFHMVEGDKIPTSSFMPIELARFVSHVSKSL